MRNLFVVAILSSAAMVGTLTPSLAACVSSGAHQYCSDNMGNSYSVQRFGRQYYITGFNAKTGATWSQTVTSAGGTTVHSGTTNGDTWNMTDQRLGDSRVLSYTDSNGRTWTYSCSAVGCRFTCNQAGCN
jgi:hypothetical protein